MKRLLMLALFAACMLFPLAAAPAQSIRPRQDFPDFSLVSPGKTALPPAGSQWHQLWPSFCTMFTQGDYQDNGDGVISPCDQINLTDPTGWVAGWHIVWVGPTYTLVPVQGGGSHYAEPDEPATGSPVCQTWTEVYPDHGLQYHVDVWEDNGNGVVDACDVVHLGGIAYHIADVDLNIITEPGPVGNDERTWGGMKALY